MGNEYGNVNVRNVKKLMLGMLGMLGSFDKCNVRSECGNRIMLGMNALISAI